MREIIPENDFPRDILDKPVQIELTIKELIAIRCALSYYPSDELPDDIEKYYDKDFVDAFDSDFPDTYLITDDLLDVLYNYEIE